uniref:Uncharacterized protein n=1 Tax=Anguilla anguilla TaxID=7936 RepID=A0A0E9TKP5_ANGAN
MQVKGGAGKLGCTNVPRRNSEMIHISVSFSTGSC